MSKIIDAYIADLRARGCKESTIKTRALQAMGILARLGEAGLCADPRRIGEADVRAIAADPALKESTAKTYVAILADLCAVMGNEAPRKVRILWNRPVTEVVWIDTHDLRLMMDAADPTDRIVLVLGAMAGLRASEITTLKVGDLHADSITVRGKGHGAGLTVDQPIAPAVRAELDAYLRWRGRDPGTDRLVVWGPNDSTEPDMVRFALYRHVRRLGESVGVRATPHALRRLYATTMYEAGVDIVTVSRLMRHSSVETTMRYIRQDRRRDHEAVARLAAALG